MKTKFCFSRTACLFLFSVLFLICQPIFAAPADPEPFDLEQPDGSAVRVQLHGDEWVSWKTTEDGFTVFLNDDGFLEYATRDSDGDLVSSGVRARGVRERTDQERNFLRGHSRDLRFSRTQINVFTSVRALRSEYEEEIMQSPMSGTMRVPVILVDFPDMPFQKTRAEFERLLNDVNNPISARNYFRDNSYGRLDLIIDVYGPYRMPNNIGTYNHRNPGGSGGPMARRALELAAQDSRFPREGYPHPTNSANGIAVHVIFAGWGQEAGAAQATSIWSHASSFSALTINGRRHTRYSCSPELRGRSGNTTAGINVFAHELGHSILGLPDYYDTDYAENGSAVAIGNWCLMASSGNADRPNRLSALARQTIGWANVITLDNIPMNVTLANPATLNLAEVYRINTRTSTGAVDTSEYFLIENRQGRGGNTWDTNIPANGMLIYRVNRRSHGWNNNRLNSVATNRGYYVEQAGCATTHGCGTRANDVWPRSTFTSFTDVSVPSSRKLVTTGTGVNAVAAPTGINTARPITDITHNTSARTVSFRFLGGASATSIGDYKAFDGSYGVIAIQNPVQSDIAEFVFKTPEAAQITMKISNSLGNVVFEARGRSTDIITWDLTNPAGRFVANGTYLVLVEAKSISGKTYWYQTKLGVKR